MAKLSILLGEKADAGANRYTPTSAREALTRAVGDDSTRAIPIGVSNLPASSLDSLRSIFSGAMEAPTPTGRVEYGIEDNRPYALRNLMTLRDSVAKHYYPDSLSAYRAGGGPAGMSDPLAYARYNAFMPHPKFRTDMLAVQSNAGSGVGLGYPSVDDWVNDALIARREVNPNEVLSAEAMSVLRNLAQPYAIGHGFGTSRNNPIASQLARMWITDLINRHEATELDQLSNMMPNDASHHNPVVGLVDLHSNRTSPPTVREALKPMINLRMAQETGRQREITDRMLAQLKEVGLDTQGLSTEDLISNTSWEDIERLWDLIGQWRNHPYAQKHYYLEN